MLCKSLMPVQAPPPTPAASATARPWAIKRLPPFPAVALQLLSLLDNEDVSMKQIVNLLRVDPALSAEILRVSNSALYGLSRRIDNVSHAVVVLGTEVVKRLALTVAIGKFTRNGSNSAALKRCWDHSMAVALLAERVAGQLHQPRDRGYTAGLLHDVGALALLTCFPSEYGNMIEVARENSFEQLECERQMFDIDHAAAGGWLARHWNLPDDLVSAISRHHDPEACGSDITSIVRCADRLAGVYGYALIEDHVHETPEEVVGDLQTKDADDFLARLEGVDEAIRNAIHTFSPH